MVYMRYIDLELSRLYTNHVAQDIRLVASNEESSGVLSRVLVSLISYEQNIWAFVLHM